MIRFNSTQVRNDIGAEAKRESMAGGCGKREEKGAIYTACSKPHSFAKVVL